MGRKVLGLEIAARSIKIALVQNGSHPELLSCSIINTPANFSSSGLPFENEADIGAIAQNIKDDLANHKQLSKGLNAAALCINNAQTIVRPITLPVLPDKELDAAVEYELSKSFPGLATTNVISFKEYRRTKTEIFGIVSFSPRKTLAAYEKLLDLLGYKQCYIDVIANSEAKAYAAFAGPEKSDRVCLLCDIGSNSTQFTIVRRREVLHSRQISEGVGSLYDQLSPEQLENMDIPESELGTISRAAYSNIVDQLRQTIEFYNMNQHEQSSVADLLLLGGGSFFPKLDEYFSAALDIPVSLITPQSNVKADGNMFARSFSAIGAAIRED